MKNKANLLIAGVLIAVLYNWLYMPFAPASERAGVYYFEASPTPTPSPSPSPSTTPKPKPKYASSEQMMKSLEYGEVVWATYGHESSYGKHDSCRSIGKYNGFGYGQRSDGTYPCYDTLEEVANIVSDWFVRNLEIYTIRQSLCRYNTGTPFNDCPYASLTMQMMGGAR